MGSLRGLKRGVMRPLWMAAVLVTMLVVRVAHAETLCVEAPDFEVVTLDQERIALSELRGNKPVYIKFWLTTCPQCIAEMPHFKETHERSGDEVQLIAINLGVDGDTPDVVRAAMAELGLEMPGVVDGQGHLQSKFGVIGTPTHVVIDVDGRVRHFGHKANEELDAVLAAIVPK